MKLSVIVPAYNQGEYIYRNMHEMLKTFKKHGNGFEVILVDDGSTDDTYKEVSLIKDKALKVVSYRRNMGKGHALKHGFKHSSGEYVTFIDSDLDIHPKNLMRFFPYMKDADMVIGSKRHPKSIVNYPLKRKVLSWGYHMFVNLLFDLGVKDTQSGIKLIRREVLEKVLPKVLVKRFAFDLELLVNAKLHGFRIKEAPIEIKYNWGNTSMVSSGAMKGIFIDTLAIAYRRYVLRWYD